VTRGLLGLLLVSGLMVTPPVAGPTAAAVAPTHTVSVSRDGAALFPDFAESIERYGVTTTDATNGSLVVTATTSDPAGTVWINGRQGLRVPAPRSPD
jgi:hypothetical protein